jgi:hypothetical protein
VNELVEKLSSYNIFNYLLPGILFAGIGEVSTSFSLIHDDVLVTLFFCYFYGLVISRLGSLILEPILKRVRFLSYAPYEDYLLAVKADKKIEVMSESNNQYRTFCALFLSLMLLNGYETIDDRIPLSGNSKLLLVFLFLFVVFLWSYRKQTNYILMRVLKAKAAEKNG